MKNKLIVAGIAALTSNAMAETNTNKFYVKVNLGMNSFKEVKENIGNIGYQLSIKTLDQKSKRSPSGSISFGYYLNDNIRTDLTIGYDEVSFKDKSYYFKPGEVVDGFGNDAAHYNGYIKAQRKATIPSIMFNVYSDIPLNNTIGVFLGAGCGIARIEQEMEESSGMDFGLWNDKEKIKSKTNNIAYNLTVGCSFKIAPSSKFDIAYVWKNFGLSKAGKYSDGDKTNSVHYKGHAINLGIRFDI